MNNIIQVTIKNVYGNELVYPACETGHALTDLLGTKTFTDWQIKKLRALGYVFEEKRSVRFA